MSLIYLEEELPEIEVQELVTGDEYLEELLAMGDPKVGLNIYSSEDIYNQCFLLLQKLQEEISIPLKRKTQAFQQLHANLVKQKVYQVPEVIVPEIAIQRKDNGDEDVFFEAYEEANKIENYHLRKGELHKVFLGFETTDEKDPVFIPEAPTRVYIKDTNKNQTVLFPRDTLHGTTTKLYSRQGISPFSDAYTSLRLVDKILEVQSHEETEHKIDPSLSVKENIHEVVQQHMSHVLEHLEEIGSMYDVWKAFIKGGISLESKEVTKEDLAKLQTKLEELRKKDKEVFEFLKAVQHYKPKELVFTENIGPYAFYVTQKVIFDKLQPILEMLKEQLLQLYQSYLDSLPIEHMDNAKIPTFAYDIITQIMEQKLTLEDAISIMKIRILKEQKANIEQWLKAVQKWDVGKIEEKVEHELLQVSKTLSSILNEPYQEWVSVHEHIKDIKKGEVVSKETVDVGVALPSLDDTFQKKEEFVVENDNPDEIPIPIYDDELPIDISSLDEGTREVFFIVVKMFMELQRSSGLPLDYARLLVSISPQLRKTKKVQLQEAFPELSPDIIAFIDKLDLSDVDSIVETVFNPTMYQQGRQSLQKIQKEFLQDIETQWTALLAWWICDLQNQVLNRTLQFEIWKGSLTCIQVWSPYGVPMEGFKPKKEGILPYLLCVIYELTFTEGTLWNRYTKQTNTEKATQLLEQQFQGPLEDIVLDLQQRSKSFEKELPAKHLMEKGEKVKKEIMDTVDKKNKNRYLADYMNFLRNLPSILVQSSIAKKLHIGCCLQMLSEKYRSDYDWAGYVKNAYKIKKLFATQRRGFEKRPYLSNVLREEKEGEKSVLESNASYVEVPVYEPWTLQSRISFYEDYMPVLDYKEFVTNVQKLTPITEKYMDIYLKMVRDTGLKDLLFSSNTQTLLEFYRKILQLQYRIIQIEYREKEKEKEYTYLLQEFSKQSTLQEELLANQSYTTELYDIQRKRLLQYYIARQLCFPSKPEYARNSTLVLLEDKLDASLLPEYIGKVYEELKIWSITKGFQKSVNFMDYIAKMREQENITKLKIIDTMNPEERRLYVEAKKLGIDELDEYIRQFRDRMEEEKQNREAVDMEEEEGEDEFYPKHGENNEEVDPDSFQDEEF
jgi:uncharacterized protein involved in tolerance to divalent cations